MNMLLRKIRLTALMSIRDLSAKSGVHWQTIRAIEMGQSKMRDLTRYKLANALGIPPETLIEKEKKVD